MFSSWFLKKFRIPLCGSFSFLIGVFRLRIFGVLGFKASDHAKPLLFFWGYPTTLNPKPLRFRSLICGDVTVWDLSRVQSSGACVVVASEFHEGAVRVLNTRGGCGPSTVHTTTFSDFACFCVSWSLLRCECVHGLVFQLTSALTCY